MKSLCVEAARQQRPHPILFPSSHMHTQETSTEGENGGRRQSQKEMRQEMAKRRHTRKIKRKGNNATSPSPIPSISVFVSMWCHTYCVCPRSIPSCKRLAAPQAFAPLLAFLWRRCPKTLVFILYNGPLVEWQLPKRKGWGKG